MRQTAKYRTLLILFTIVIVLIVMASLISSFFSGRSSSSASYTAVDAHEGQVLINDGYDLVWMTPLEGVRVSPFTEADFGTREGEISYLGSDYTVQRGIDVSEHQLQIDWAQAAKEIDFAYIRIGYRGYTEGQLFTDPRFAYNFENANKNGVLTGVYFFSQAVSPEEATEEAEYVLKLLNGASLSLPVMYDWEKIDDSAEARTNDVTNATRTACAQAFCKTITDAGYQAGVYFNRRIGYYGYDLSALTDYTFWVSVPGDFPDFYYAAEFWQYSFEEKVSGISELCDMNLRFIPVSGDASEPTASPSQ